MATRSGFFRRFGSQRTKTDEQLDWSKQGVKKLKNEIRKMASKTRGLDPPKILFIGETGSGKSSFISSAISSLTGNITYVSAIGEKKGHEVNNTKRYLEHRVFMTDEEENSAKRSGIEENPLNFVLCDSRGLAKRGQQGAADEEIERLIDGKFRHGDWIEEERNYDGSRISDREPHPPHCVVFVQRAQPLGETDRDVKEKLDKAMELVKERAIPSCVILTHIDRLKPGLENSLHLALNSTRVRQRIQATAQEVGVTENRVFVVKNYVKEGRTHTRHDILILRALRGILLDVEQRDRDKLALSRISLRTSQAADSGFGSSVSDVQSASFASSSSINLGSVPESGPSTSVSQYEDRRRQREEGVRRSQRWTQEHFAHHQRHISAPFQEREHPDAIKHSLSSGELPREFEYHVEGSPPESVEDKKSDKENYLWDEEDSGVGSLEVMPTELQKSVNTLHDQPFPERYTEEVELKGAKALYKPTILQLNSNYVSTAKESCLQNQLKKEDDREIGDLLDKFLGHLENWAEAKRQACVWLSDTLPTDLSLPLDEYLPDSVKFQALFLAIGRPACLLSVYDPERVLEGSRVSDERESRKLKAEETEYVTEVTTRVSKLLTAALFSYCHCDFILLPVVINVTQLGVETLQREVEKQQGSSRSYFGGPRCLSQRSYEELKAAATAVCNVSHVPTFLSSVRSGHDPDSTQVKQRLSCSSDAYTEERLYLLDPAWQSVVSLLIQRLSHSYDSAEQQVTAISYSPEASLKMYVAVMEAAKRLSFVDDVVVVTSDKSLLDCCRLLKERVYRDTGVDLKLSVVILDKMGQQTTPDISANILIILDLPDFHVQSDAITVHIYQNRVFQRIDIITEC